MNENKIRFALVIHNHQPVDNRDDIIERIYQSSYLPFTKKLSEYPEIRANIHYTGFLLDWIENHHPEFIDVFRALVDRGQIEVMTGAYYEPILAVVPDSDAKGQIRLLSKKIRSLFGVEPRGFWTAERAWEPHLPEVLAESNVDYTLLDDSIFSCSGLDESELFEPYLVESRGYSIRIFPILKRLRYSIPFKPVQSTISFLRNSLKSHRQIAVLGDDGEKFGAWPSTYNLVFAEGWLDEFFRALTREKNWIETVKLGEFLKNNGDIAKTYLPSASYPEMMEWSIPFHPRNTKARKNEDSQSNLRGFWRLFFAKYPESAQLYQKMLSVSRLVNSITKTIVDKDSALGELWKGQCNDAYWHGVFGGLYAPILRMNTYSHIIRGQLLAEEQIHPPGSNWISAENPSSRGGDFDVNTASMDAIFSPSRGGSVIELDYKKKFVNLIDTLARHPEKYHENIRKLSEKTIVPGKKKAQSIHDASVSKQKGLEKLLVYDRYPRFSFLDHLVVEKTGLKNFLKQDYFELAEFAGATYSSEIERNDQTLKVKMERISSSNRIAGDIHLEKEYVINQDSPSLTVSYAIYGRGISKKNSRAKFVTEINLGCLSDDKFVSRYSKEPSSQNSNDLEIAYDEIGFRVKLAVDVDGDSSTWIMPITTVSQSESGFEANLQGISVMPNFEVNLLDESPRRATFRLVVGS